MIVDTNASIEFLLRRDIFANSKLQISFETPTKAWNSARQGPALNCWLYDLRENLTVKHVGEEPLYDERGRVYAYRPVPRYIDHCYLLSAWASQATTEFKVLQSVLTCLLGYDLLPPDVLQGALTKQRRTLAISVAQGAKRSMMLNLAGEQKLAIEFEVAVPYYSNELREVTHRVEEPPRIAMHDAQGTPLETRSSPHVAARIAAGAVPAQPQQPVAAPVPAAVPAGMAGATVRVKQPPASRPAGTPPAEAPASRPAGPPPADTPPETPPAR